MAEPAGIDLEQLLKGLTLAQKVHLVSGASLWRTHALPESGIPTLKVSDGPNGVRGDGGESAAAFPVGICMGATWNPELIADLGIAIAEEAKTKDVQVVLGPTINLHRTPLGGRNFECYSEDPILSGELAAAFTNGVQSQGVGACLKHFVCNDSEFERHTISVAVDEQTLREVYLRPFQIAIEKSQPWTVMAAYNRINGIYACSHTELLGDVLKGEWGFQGLVMSDWFAAKETVDNAIGHLDLEMPGPSKVWGSALQSAVESGQVPMALLDDKVRRLLRVMAWSGRFKQPTESPERSVDEQAHRDIAYQTAVEGMVLLKNTGLLPLSRNRIQKLAVIGPNVAHFRIMGGGSSALKPHYVSTPLAALAEKFPGMDILSQGGCPTFKYIPEPDRNLLLPLENSVENAQGDANGLTVKFYADTARTQLIRQRVIAQSTVHASLLAGAANAVTLEGTYQCEAAGDYTFGLLSTGRAAMWVNGAELIDNWTAPTPGDAFFMQSSAEVRATRRCQAGELLQLRIIFEVKSDTLFKGLRYGILPPQFEDPISEAVKLAATSDAVVLLVGTNDDWETEGNDRETLTLPGAQDELIARVLAVNPNTVVVNNSGAPITMPWADSAPAILQCWFPGQEFGRALADLLFGDANPSGRLPLTFPKSLEDVPAYAHYPGENGVVRYEEGLNIGYRGFAGGAPAPLFAFGHGLSYSQFEYSGFSVSVDDQHESVMVNFSLTNLSDCAGQEVVQVYATFAGDQARRPNLMLVGFQKLRLGAGESVNACLSVPLERLGFWSVDLQAFAYETSPCTLHLGRSANDLICAATLSL